MRPSIDEVYLEMAQVLSKRAACTRRQVGALVADEDGRLASSGYNGTAHGLPNCTDGGCPRGKLSYLEKPPMTGYEDSECVHAEQNALLRAGERSVGGTLFVSCQPCGLCGILIKASRLARVVYFDSDNNIVIQNLNTER